MVVIVWPSYPDECLAADLISRQLIVVFRFRLPIVKVGFRATVLEEAEFVCSLRVSSA